MMSPLFRRTSRCPYCEQVLATRPWEDTACPHCHKQIHVRRGKLLTQEELTIHERLEFLGEFGFTRRAFDRKRDELSDQLDRPASVNEAALALLQQLAQELDHNCGLVLVYGEMVHVLRTQGKNPTGYLAEVMHHELLTLEKADYYQTVQITTMGDDKVCPACRELADTVLTVSEALKTMPLPHACQNPGGCRCNYLPE